MFTAIRQNRNSVEAATTLATNGSSHVKSQRAVKQLSFYLAAAFALATFTPGPLPAQATPFLIKSVSSGLVLDLPNSSTTMGQEIGQWQTNFGVNQQWQLTRSAGSGGYEIASVSSQQVLDVPNSSIVSGTAIGQWPAHNGINQQWKFVRDSVGYEIISLDPSNVIGIVKGNKYPSIVPLVLDVNNFSKVEGEVIRQYLENGGTNQQWQFLALSSPNISLTGNSNGTITFSGWGFRPFSQVCPVIGFDRTVGPLSVGPCVTATSYGTFFATVDPTDVLSRYSNETYKNTSPGYVVATVEDSGGHLLAISSVIGGWNISTLGPF